MHREGQTYLLGLCEGNRGKGGSFKAGPSNQAAAARSLHPGGVQAVHLDGSVKFYLDGVAPEIWRAALTRSGGESVRTD